jgi:hypothetical protein
MRVIRVLFGFALACLAAAATLVLFVYTPAELASLPSGMGADRATEAGLFALVVTPHVAAFAALPALIGVFIAERRSISSLGYYAILGIAIAALGFLMQHVTETPGQTTILHNYALTAFLTAGLAGGLIYWLCSGRYVTGRAGPSREPERSSKPVSAAASH